MMRMMRYLLAMILTATFLPAAMLASSAAKDDQINLRWRAPVIRLAISNSLFRPGSGIKADSDVSGAIKRSLAAWSDAADVEFVFVESERQSISPSGPAGDGVSLISISQTPENVMLFSRDPNAESARTRVFYNRVGSITEADIVLNPFLQFSTDGTFGTFDLESTLTHEIGHLLGIRHSGVIGSIMSESLARNNEMSGLDGSRKLSASDIAAVRQVYGAAQAEDCCASITGKLTTAAARSYAGITVWVEENGTGRVAAWAETAADGSFVLGGMPGGSYSLLWQRVDENAPSTIGHLGMVKLTEGQTLTVSQRLDAGKASAGLYFIGLNSQLTDSALTLEAGREHIVFIGGTGLDSAKIGLEFNSPFMTVTPETIRTHDFGDDLSVVSFVLRISPDAPRGAYSIFATDDAGIQAALTGAVVVK
jgi:hypothetical protein